jgi:hypothetical protein
VAAHFVAELVPPTSTCVSISFVIFFVYEAHYGGASMSPQANRGGLALCFEAFGCVFLGYHEWYEARQKRRISG